MCTRNNLIVQCLDLSIESFIMHNLIGCLIDIILVYLWFCPWFCHVLMNLRLLANTVYRVYTHINRDWTLPRYFVKCHLFWANSQISRQNNIQFMFPGVTDLNVVKNVLFPWKFASVLWFLVLENREKVLEFFELIVYEPCIYL